MVTINKRGLTDLGYRLFLDRYALKDGTRDSLTEADIVLYRPDPMNARKEVGRVKSFDNGSIELYTDLYSPDTILVDKERVDKPLELDPKQMWERAARWVSLAEEPDAQAYWEAVFYVLLEDWKFLPGGRILSAAGVDEHILSSYNCFVLPSPTDSKPGIFETLEQMAHIMSMGGGVGINTSTLRPRYAYTHTTNGRSSGAVSWSEIYSVVTGLIEQGGSRRGALMLILEDWHPDIIEFINVKRQAGRLINTNISVGISDRFMAAVKADGDWELVFPDTSAPDYDNEWNGNLDNWIKRGLPVKLYKTVKARELWSAIIESAWASAEPGLWFKDMANHYSNSWYYNQLICTNPCGEQPLGAWNVCNLGSINLPKFIDIDGAFDWASFHDVISAAVRFLDNVIDLAKYPYPETEVKQKAERRVGLGVMGLAELLIRLKLRYGSPEALEFTNSLFGYMAHAAYRVSAELAKEKGPFKQFNTDMFLRSGFMKGMPDDVIEAIQHNGMRNVTLLTMAPTGTIGTMAGTSTGIEPYYFWEYTRKTRMGDYLERASVYEEWMAFKGEREAIDGESPQLPDWFVTAQDLTPQEHISMQAAIQQWVDSSISKTCNVPYDYTIEQVGELYMMMYDTGCKGGTVYRDKSRSEQILNLADDPAQPALGWRKRPQQLDGTTHRANTPVGTGYVTINVDDAGPFEVFITIGKAGSTISAIAEGIGRLISLILRMPSTLSTGDRLKSVVSQLGGIGSGRQFGFGKSRVTSVPDAISRVLSEHAELGTAMLSGMPEEARELGLQADICPDCGEASLVRIEGCEKCVNCGHAEC